MSKSKLSITERLEAEEQDEKITKLRDRVRSHVRKSRGQMSKYYDQWDRYNDVYMGVRSQDEEDLDARDHQEPEKLVVPMAFAQIQTFVAFCFLLFTQNKRFYEMLGSDSSDEDLQIACSKILERDLRKNNFHAILYQKLLDVARFNLGVVKHWWAVETQEVRTTVKGIDGSASGFTFRSGNSEVVQDVISFEGNRLANVSPYNFFPDTRFPMTDWHKGAFVADESEWHISQLYEWEQEGTAFGVEHIKPMTTERLEQRGKTRLDSFVKYVESDEQDEDDQIVVITECQLKIIPKKFGLGDEDYAVPYVVVLANDDRVIRCEPANYMHNSYTYDVAQFSPDMHQSLGASLSDMMDALQDVVSYLINSRLMSVRKSLGNQLVVDPSGVDMASVEARSGVIRMKKGAPRLGVDKFVRQLNFTDTTSTHLQDADIMMKLLQTVTGLNENSMGQFNGGRRSATEAKAANSGAASRTKVVAKLIWSCCLAPLGEKMLSNHRQGLSFESFVKILGQENQDLYDRFSPEDPALLVGLEDYFVFDGTLQSEKGFIAQSLQELVQAMFSNPLVMQILPMDIGKLLEEVLILRGVENIDRFKLQSQPNAGPGIPLQQPNIDPATGMPAVDPTVPSIPGLPGLPGGA